MFLNLDYIIISHASTLHDHEPACGILTLCYFLYIYSVRHTPSVNILST